MPNRVPPPRESSTQAVEPRRPGLAKSCALDRRLAMRDVLRRWAARHHVSERELAEVLLCSKRRADDFLDGSAPFPVDGVLALPDRHALDLLDELRSLILSRRSA